jgi:hypothetical protein
MSHAAQRLQERTTLPPETLERLERVARDLEVTPGHYYLPLNGPDGNRAGYAAYKTVGPANQLVLATVLGPDMQPKGSSLSHLKTADDTRLQEKFKQLTQYLNEHGVFTGTKHKRISVPKAYMPESVLDRLGFVPVTIAIPENGQDTFTSWRHPDHTYHVHSHPNYWTMHQDAHPAATMLMRPGDPLKKKLKALNEGVPHVVTEGLPGLGIYLKGQLLRARPMLERIHEEIPEDVQQKIHAIDFTDDGIRAALKDFGIGKSPDVSLHLARGENVHSL